MGYLLFGETIYSRMTIINQSINKRKIYICLHCAHEYTRPLLPQLLDGHVLLAVFLHHLEGGERDRLSSINKYTENYSKYVNVLYRHAYSSCD